MMNTIQTIELCLLRGSERSLAFLSIPRTSSKANMAAMKAMKKAAMKAAMKKAIKKAMKKAAA